MKQKIFYIGISLLIIIGVCIRFYAIHTIPLGLYFDEMDYVFTGRSLFLFGSDITGVWQPISLKPLQLINNISELSSIFYVFGGEHLVSAFFGLASSILLAVLAFLITKNTKIFLTVLSTAIVSPWLIYISRVSYEGVISLTFQLILIVAFYWFIFDSKVSLKKNLFTGSLAFFGAFFAYFTYHGAKFTTLMLLFCIVLLIFLQKRIELKRRFLFATPLVFLAVFFLIHTRQMYTQGFFGSRSSEIIFNSEYLTKTVDEYRKKSVQVPFQNVVYSKPAIIFQAFTQNYLGVFDLYNWGILGRENIFQFSLFVHGFLYLSSIPLLFYGLLYLYRNYTENAKKLLLFLAISPITSAIAIGQTQNIFRSALTYAILLVFIGAGLFASLQKYKKIKFLVFIVLICETIYFGLMYFSRYPIITADNHYFSEKLVSAYVAKIEKPMVIVTENSGQSYTIARSILYFSDTLNTVSEEERKSFIPGKNQYQLGNILITNITDTCPSINLDTIYIVSPAQFDNCFDNKKNDQKIGLGSPIDSRIYFYILNDTICDHSALNTYVYQNNIQKFDILKSSSQEFCNNWVITE